ncbi:MAG: integral membrane glycosyltransferase, partial [Gemmatimonadetes bacterium]|nr:integral membrane glycosyltransferase [Gemmatimonadota bacterium]
MNRDHFWRHRVAEEVRFSDRIWLSILTGAGLVGVVRLADWWFRRPHVANLPLFITLSLGFWYGISRIVLGWINYAAMGKPRHRPPGPGLRVAIFVTSAPGEPLAMFERTLAACARVVYPHTTYLLDDT